MQPPSWSQHEHRSTVYHHVIGLDVVLASTQAVHLPPRTTMHSSEPAQSLISTLPPRAGWLDAMMASTAFASGKISPAQDMVMVSLQPIRSSSQLQYTAAASLEHSYPPGYRCKEGIAICQLCNTSAVTIHC